MSPRGPAFPGHDALCDVFSAPIAHRGLWSPQGPAENSLSAFASAVDQGYGIELDVRLSVDGVPMVFHDRHLARMASAAAELREKTADQLAALRLKGSQDPIPTLTAALDVIAGRGPVLVELKTEDGAVGAMETKVAETLGGYGGCAAVIGFNPLSHAWFAANRPELPRGLNLDLKPDAPLQDEALDEMINIARPHFLLPGGDGLDAVAVAALHERQLPLVVWTVRSPERWRAMSAYCDSLIFEGWRP